jgi:hypothetical protein
MKPSLLISTAVAILVAAAAASSPLLAAPTSSSAARQAAVRILPGFRSPSGNIKCFVVRSLYCEIDNANYRQRLQASCGLDWHGFQLTPRVGRGPTAPATPPTTWAPSARTTRS